VHGGEAVEAKTLEVIWELLVRARGLREAVMMYYSPPILIYALRGQGVEAHPQVQRRARVLGEKSL
jgi:hypothetical protein